MSRAARALAASVLALLAACGGSSGPVAIPADEIPFDLRRAVEPAEESGRERGFVAYFVRRDRLVPVSRAVTTAVPLSEGAMRALIEGPTDRERDRGIISHVPQPTRVLRILVVNQVAQVDLSSEFQVPGPSETIVLRVAQVVWTLTELPGVNAVRFAIDGSPVSALTDGGAVVDRPVGKADYGTVGPR